MKPLKIVPFERPRTLEHSDMPLDEREDDELVLIARGGIGEAFDTLVRRHQKKALRVASKILGQSSLALDAAQNAFFDIYRNLDKYQARGRFVSYMYRVLLNQCLMAKRVARRQHRITEKLCLQKRINGDLAENIVLAREKRRELERALGKLSDKLRSVVVLRFVADLSYAEIGDVLKIPTGTVKSRMFSGLRRLRQILERNKL
jgi:RNA polymerase sigma-70 factor (ECF subfamily)